MTRRWGILAIAAATLTLSACSPGALPLSIPDGTSLCTEPGDDRAGSVGVPVTNTSSTPITLTDAYPSGVSVVEVTGTWIADATDQNSTPVFADERDPGSEYVDWDAREAPDGAVIEAGETRYLVISLELPDGSDRGWIEGVTIASGDGTAASDVGYGLSPGGGGCPWSPPQA
jgi:hypothetical protein